MCVIEQKYDEVWKGFLFIYLSSVLCLDVICLFHFGPDATYLVDSFRENAHKMLL